MTLHWTAVRFIMPNNTAPHCYSTLHPVCKLLALCTWINTTSLIEEQNLIKDRLCLAFREMHDSHSHTINRWWFDDSHGLFYWMRFKNSMPVVKWLVSNSVQSHTKLLPSERTCCLNLIGNMNTMKKEAGRFFRNLTTNIVIHGVIIRTPRDRSLCWSRFSYEGIF